MNYYLYILFSKKADIFYVGFTHNIEKRLEQHNHSNQNTFTSKYRPWVVHALFKVNGNKSDAIKIESFIKKQKSKSFLFKLGQEDFIPNGKLAQLVRVPYLRD